MKRLLMAMVITLAVVSLVGWMMSDRVNISVHKVKGRPDLDVIVTVPPVTQEMHTLFLEACIADMAEDGAMYCQEDGWYMNSAHPMRSDQRQYPFLLRNVPRGWLMLSAVVVDGGGKTITSGQTRIVR